MGFRIKTYMQTVTLTAFALSSCSGFLDYGYFNKVPYWTKVTSDYHHEHVESNRYIPLKTNIIVSATTGTVTTSTSSTTTTTS